MTGSIRYLVQVARYDEFQRQADEHRRAGRRARSSRPERGRIHFRRRRAATVSSPGTSAA